MRLLSFRTLRMTALALILCLAGLTVAYAATGNFPLTPAHKSAARAFSARAAGLLAITNSLDGQALLTATAMAPGESRVGQVTITNSGNIPGDFTLSDSALTDSPAPTPFSSVAQLLIQDISTPALPVTIYAGTVAGLTPVPLGTFATAEARTYRFTVTFPNGTPAHDNPLQGASTTVRYDWTASAPDSSSPTDTTTLPTTTTAPVLGAGDPPPTQVVPPPTTTTKVTTIPTNGPRNLPHAWKVKLTAKPRRRMRTGRVDYVVSCGKACSVVFGGTIKIPPLHKAFKVRRVRFTVPAGGAVRVQVRLSPTMRAGLKRALRAHKRPTITATVTARSGKLHATAKRRVRFVR